MSLTTGGRASGATSTRSSPRSSARSRASSIETIPTCPPSSSIRRTGLIRICSFMRVLSWLIFLSSHESPQLLPPDFWHLPIKKPGSLRVTRSRKPQAILQVFRVLDPAVSNIGCGTERWSRVCVGSLPSCLEPRTPGSRKIGGMGASVKTRKAVREELPWHTGRRGPTVRPQSILPG